MMRTRLSGVVSLVILVALAATGMAAPVTPPRAAQVDVHTTETILTFPALDDAAEPSSEPLGALVALPRGATSASATLISGQAGTVEVVGKLMRQRGLPVVLIQVQDPGEGDLVVAVHHNGDWAAKSSVRLTSRVLDASLPGASGPAGLKSADNPAGGSYVIITGSQFASAMAPMAQWKMRKGWPVVQVTTDETGSSNEAIKAWLQNAYDTWDLPPEYVLLVGDVDVIPSWSFSGNVTDLPYAHLDGDDWLPDVMLGRFSVSNQSECQAMVAKSVAYEQTPYTANSQWFTRSVMVAGQYASTTPMHTVRFCGDQLASIGFDPMVPVAPVGVQGDDWLYNDGNYIVSGFQNQLGFGVRQNEGDTVLKAALDAGTSMVAYRGWAYGTAGWEPPHYTVDEIPALANGAMTPVVMSFVCLNGDFSHSDACFGEVFTRTGGSTPESFRGAVAFIGNGEHWSHTRFNDAMAISVFERAVDFDITTLGGLLNAGKLRFLECFPGELEDQGDEESVEFYFHIYNLLGDPELNFYRALPTPLLTAHDADATVGTSYLEVTVTEQDGSTAVPGARVGVVQNGVLLGRALAGDDGMARLVLTTPLAAGEVEITASASDRIPVTSTLDGVDDDHLQMGELGLDDTAGNGDGVLNPGEAIEMLPLFTAVGIESDPGSATLSLEGPVTLGVTSVEIPFVESGPFTPSAPFTFTVDADAEDGSMVTGTIVPEHDGVEAPAGVSLTVAAPELQAVLTQADGDGWLDAGTVNAMRVTLRNDGSVGTDGGDIVVTLTAPATGVTLGSGTLDFAAVAAGESLELDASLDITVAGDLGEGQSAVLNFAFTCDDGAEQAASVSLPVGSGAVSEPAGPDAHGYYAYDSADYLYDDQRPVYRWQELSTEFGGSGTKLPFLVDNYDTDITLDLPFSFTYYGQSFDRIRVSDNGWISFEDTSEHYNFYNWPLPSEYGNGAIIAPFWDNLSPEPMLDPESDPVGLDSDGVYWHHDTVNDELIIEWSRMRHLKYVLNEDEPGIPVTDLKTFQVVLRDPSRYTTPSGDGEILFFYKQVADNDSRRMYASVGLESPDESDGIQLTYDGVRSRGTLPLGPGQAIRLTTAPPVRQPLPVAMTRRVVGNSVNLSWTCSDTRPITGWRVYAVAEGRKISLTDEALPAHARSVVVHDVDHDLLLEALFPHGASCEAGKVLASDVAPRFALRPPVPNPMHGESSIAFALPRSGHTRLRVFDVRGRLVRTLINEDATAGDGMVVWQGRDDRGHQLADGVYFCRLEHDGNTLTQKLLLVR